MVNIAKHWRTTGGQTLLAATDRGAVRCYRLPLTSAFSEVCKRITLHPLRTPEKEKPFLKRHHAAQLRVAEGPIHRMVLSHDSSQLFVAAEDGNVTVLDVKDRV